MICRSQGQYVAGRLALRLRRVAASGRCRPRCCAPAGLPREGRLKGVDVEAAAGHIGEQARPSRRRIHAPHPGQPHAPVRAGAADADVLEPPGCGLRISLRRKSGMTKVSYFSCSPAGSLVAAEPEPVGLLGQVLEARLATPGPSAPRPHRGSGCRRCGTSRCSCPCRCRPGYKCAEHVRTRWWCLGSLVR